MRKKIYLLIELILVSAYYSLDFSVYYFNGPENRFSLHSYGLFTLRKNLTRPGVGNRADTIGNDRS